MFKLCKSNMTLMHSVHTSKSSLTLNHIPKSSLTLNHIPKSSLTLNHAAMQQCNNITLHRICCNIPNDSSSVTLRLKHLSLIHI